MRSLLIGLIVVCSACGPLGPPKDDGGTGGGTGGGLFTGGGTGGGTGGSTGGGTGGGSTGGGGGALGPLTWASMAINGGSSSSYVIALGGSATDLWAVQDTGGLFHSSGGAFDFQFAIQYGAAALYAAGGTVVIVQTRSIRTCTANCTTEAAFATFTLLNSGMNWNLFGEAACGRGPNDITVVVSDQFNMGQLFHWDGVAWTRTNGNLGIAYPRACWFDAAGVLYVVGQDDVARSDSGAVSLEHLSTNGGSYYGGAEVEGTSWVVGPSSYLAHRNNGTATWTPVSSTGGTTTLWAVGGLSANEIYAFGYYTSSAGNGYQWNGSTLASVGDLLPNAGSQSVIRTMHVTAPNELYVAGSNQSGPLIIRGRRP